MVRRGSPVRVRKRAPSKAPQKRGFCFCSRQRIEAEEGPDVSKMSAGLVGERTLTHAAVCRSEPGGRGQKTGHDGAYGRAARRCAMRQANDLWRKKGVGAAVTLICPWMSARSFASATPYVGLPTRRRRAVSARRPLARRTPGQARRGLSRHRGGFERTHGNTEHPPGSTAARGAITSVPCCRSHAPLDLGIVYLGDKRPLRLLPPVRLRRCRGVLVTR